MYVDNALVSMARKAVGLGRRLLYGESWSFFTSSFAAFIKARMDHLASLNLNLSKKSVLEVGAGIGLLTKFFEDRGCYVLSSDGNPKRVEEIRRRYPWRRAVVLDLDKTLDLSSFGQFETVFCYGTLYHLSRPEQALKALSRVCREAILLETCVSLGTCAELHFVGDPIAVSGVGCRPTRSWVMETLRKDYGYAYMTKTQPRHQDFPLNWRIPPLQLNYRAVFVGSKQPLENPNLLEAIPDYQQTE